MQETRILMGMPITVEIVDKNVSKEIFDRVYDYLKYIDETFSTYKSESEISRINRGEILEKDWSADMKLIFEMSEKTKEESRGYFDIKKDDGTYDPSGIVKGYAVWKAAELIKKAGLKDFYINAGGDIEVHGKNKNGEKWTIGIRNPFKDEEIVKALSLSDCGIATSGTYIRGQHIYNPKGSHAPVQDIQSLTVIGPNVYDADRFATAAYAMGKEGINFIECLEGYEGYQIDNEGIGTETSNFKRYIL